MKKSSLFLAVILLSACISSKKKQHTCAYLDFGYGAEQWDTLQKLDSMVFLLNYLRDSMYYPKRMEIESIDLGKTFCFDSINLTIKSGNLFIQKGNIKNNTHISRLEGYTMDLSKVYQLSPKLYALFLGNLPVNGANTSLRFYQLILVENNRTHFSIASSTDWISSDSPYTIADYNHDGKWDYFQWEANMGDSIGYMYTYEKEKMTKTSYYVKLHKLDGFVYYWDIKASNWCTSLRHNRNKWLKNSQLCD